MLLPIWQAEFGLSYAEVGLLRGAFAGAMAAFQIPAGWLSERIGAATMLAAGTALSAFAFLLVGTAAGYLTLVALLLVGGLGSSVQHPIASSVVARAFAGVGSRIAIGNYNFAGDIGKMTLPAATAFLLTVRPGAALTVIAGIGVVAAVATSCYAPHGQSACGREKHDEKGPGLAQRKADSDICSASARSKRRAYGVSDVSAVRSGREGASIAVVGVPWR